MTNQPVAECLSTDVSVLGGGPAGTWAADRRTAATTRRTLVAVGWFERVKKAAAGQRVTGADRRQATAVFDELGMLNAERDRLTRDGIRGVATITAIGQNVATTALGTWHELVLEVRLSNRELDLPDLIRSLDVGQAIFSSAVSDVQRFVVADVRPRNVAHGGEAF